MVGHDKFLLGDRYHGDCGAVVPNRTYARDALSAIEAAIDQWMTE